MNIRKISLYVHWPFCKSLCPYCDFNSHLISQYDDKQSWLKAYINEINYFVGRIQDNYEIQTIFFGGGTPSLMDVNVISELINYVKNNLPCSNNIEITIESNPTSFEASKMEQLSIAGVNRISIGVQSFIKGDLLWLGRNHDENEAIAAIKAASTIFPEYSFDLIYGRKNQTIESWSEELLFAISLAKNHLSLYNLAIEKGTHFYHLKKQGKLDLPSEELNTELYLKTLEIMSRCGFLRYEVSNFCKHNKRSLHNMSYWQLMDYMGVGAGAHGRLHYKNGTRMQTCTFHSPKKWYEQAVSKIDLQIEKPISTHDQIREIFTMGMRTIDGIDLDYIKANFNINLLSYIHLDQLKMAIGLGLLTYENNIIAPTQNGLNVVNSINDKLINLD